MNNEIKEKYIKAGKIASQARTYGISLIREGITLLEVTEKVEKKIIELGGSFAFPPQISLNNVAAHYCADYDDKTIFKKGDIAKLDVGVMIDGFIGDTAETICVGYENDENYIGNKLIKASKEALNNAIKIIKPGIHIGEIGKIIQETIKSYGFSPVRNLSGHGLDKYVFHAKPSIPNFDTGDKTKLEKGFVIAIEPFASTGKGIIYESSNANIFSQIAKKPVRSLITKQILIEIEKYKNMPFTTRWLAYKFGLQKTNFALRELLQLGIIRSYPPLPDADNGLVSQAEHTIIIEDKIIVTTL
ncbi:MAG: type II methionyl aminopeptidase [Candidatus Woesearchaeota archaeon]